MIPSFLAHVAGVQRVCKGRHTHVAPAQSRCQQLDTEQLLTGKTRPTPLRKLAPNPAVLGHSGEIRARIGLTANLRFQLVDPISQILDATLSVYIEPIEDLHCVVICVLRSNIACLGLYVLPDHDDGQQH